MWSAFAVLVSCFLTGSFDVKVLLGNKYGGWVTCEQYSFRGSSISRAMRGWSWEEEDMSLLNDKITHKQVHIFTKYRHFVTFWFGGYVFQQACITTIVIVAIWLSPHCTVIERPLRLYRPIVTHSLHLSPKSISDVKKRRRLSIHIV